MSDKININCEAKAGLTPALGANQLHPAHLGETVEEVLNSSVQDAIPQCIPCGPGPYEYKEFVESHWPVRSGEEWSKFSDYGILYDTVRHTALPNFMVARVPIRSGLNIKAWRRELAVYSDSSLPDLLEFGFPANYSIKAIPVPTYKNHREKIDYTSFIRKYIVSECKLGALLGPFSVPPYTPWCQSSPIMTREKSTPGQRRIIVDLSYPPGRSVNSGIPRREYLGAPYIYTLPTVTQVGDRLHDLGPGAYMWSADISRAYRQLRTDPLSSPLFCITMDEQLYIDTALPFGCRSSGAACVRMTAAIRWMMSKRNWFTLVYVDDFIGVELTYLEAVKAFDCFINICEALGIELAKNKCHPPSVRLTWIGFHLDVETMSISIPEPKLEQVLIEAKTWLERPRASKQALQKLIGKLVHVSSCIPPGRRFISRILRALSRAHYSEIVVVDNELKRDVQWFCSYAQRSNGIFLIPDAPEIIWQIECDSCLSGGGAFSPEHFFHEKYDKDFISRFTTIHSLEAVNLVEAVATLRPQVARGARIVVNTDNQASAQSLQSGKCTDSDLGLCSRELWLLAAIHNFELQVMHKPGALLVLADALSRAHTSRGAARIITEQSHKLGITRIRVRHSEHRFTTDL